MVALRVLGIAIDLVMTLGAMRLVRDYFLRLVSKYSIRLSMSASAIAVVTTLVCLLIAVGTAGSIIAVVLAKGLY